MKLNTSTGKSYDFNAPSANEDTSRTVKYPITTASTVAYGATINDTVGRHKRSIRDIALTGNATINVAAAAGESLEIGDELLYRLANDAAAARTVTFGTGFKAVSTVVGTESKSINVLFMYDGANFVEVCRTAAYTA